MAFYDFSFPLKKGTSYAFPEGLIDLISNTRQSIKHILLSIKGERLNGYNYGLTPSVLSNVLFNPSDKITASLLDQDIRKAINEYLPEIKIVKLNILNNEENPEYVEPNTIMVILNYTSNGIEDAIRVSLQERN